MLRAMVAWTASTSSCKWGGLKKQPRKMTAAKASTTACSRLRERSATVVGCGNGSLVMTGIFKKWWPGTELNRRHADFQSAALPTELPGREGWASIECVRLSNYNNLHFEPPNRVPECCERVENHARLWVQLWRKMLFSRTFWRNGICVLLCCVAQAYSQTPVTAPANQTSVEPSATTSVAAPNQSPADHSAAAAPATAGAENKTTAPIIPGLTTLPTSQAGPPATPDSQQAPPPAGLQISSGDLLDIGVYGVPDLTQKVRVSNSGDAYFPLLGSVNLDGLTLEDAQSTIEKKLVDAGIMKNPHVTIFVSEYSSGVSMLGLIQKPGIYPLLGTRRLYDMISAAGGLSPGAGRLITVTHRSDPMNPIL